MLTLTYNRCMIMTYKQNKPQMQKGIGLMENNMKNVMVRAWKIARKAAVKFGGSAKQYIAEALTMAWEAVSKEMKAKKMPQAEFDAIVDGQIKNIRSEMKKHLLFYGAKIEWVIPELNNLIEQGIAQMKRERIIYVEKAAYLTIDKHF